MACAASGQSALSARLDRAHALATNRATEATGRETDCGTNACICHYPRRRVIDNVLTRVIYPPSTSVISSRLSRLLVKQYVHHRFQSATASASSLHPRQRSKTSSHVSHQACAGSFSSASMSKYGRLASRRRCLQISAYGDDPCVVHSMFFKILVLDKSNVVVQRRQQASAGMEG